MSLRPYKFIVTPIVQRLDGDGTVVGEENLTAHDAEGNSHPIILFGCEQLEAWAREFPAQLAASADPGA
jgi:hypothetical protein